MKMRQQPGADQAQLDTIYRHITEGVSLPFISIPSPVNYANTNTVVENMEVVRTRLAEYMSFGAVVEMPASYSPTHGIQPLHVIIKADKKPRLVIDLSRNLNDYLVQTPFHYTKLEDAVAISSPGCWYSKIDLTNCFLSFPLHPDAQPYFTFSFENKLYQFHTHAIRLVNSSFHLY
jgi:hypothetical protein